MQRGAAIALALALASEAFSPPASVQAFSPAAPTPLRTRRFGVYEDAVALAEKETPGSPEAKIAWARRGAVLRKDRAPSSKFSYM